MKKDLPDYCRYFFFGLYEDNPEEYPTVHTAPLPVMPRFQMFTLWTHKVEEALTTDYLKQGCILPINVVVSDPTGAIPSYESGWACLALLERGTVGDQTLVKNILDELVKMQYADGSWEQQYYPLRTKTGGYNKLVPSGAPYNDIQVDSGASMVAWAMSLYDYKINPGVSVVYKDTVRKALQFLRECQYRHTLAHGTNLLANQRWNYIAGSPIWNTAALACDCAEALLAMHAALTQYGDTLTTWGGYSVKTMANDLYYSMATVLWNGDPAPSSVDDAYFITAYPRTAIPWLMPADIVPQAISYTQGMVAMAIYRWAKSAFRDPGISDYSYLCERALNYACAITEGKWGGFYYHPIAPGYGQGIEGNGFGLYDEFPAFTAIMVMGMKEVNQAKYQNHIDRAIAFIRTASLPGGRVFNRVKIDGSIDLGEGKTPGDGMHFRVLNTSQGLFAGA